ncbi:MAG: hypothetical protein CXR30_16340 [Geobacter sp.]|nr:MAG: hypothetical protein CXR30_16340 [Geobacter sp.]
MPIPIHELSGSEPVEDKCLTGPASEHFSICLNGNWRCRYSQLADDIRNYCIHPHHKQFQRNEFSIPNKIAPGQSKENSAAMASNDIMAQTRQASSADKKIPPV